MIMYNCRHFAIVAGLLGASLASVWSLCPQASAQEQVPLQQALRTCSEVHAYCLKLCSNGTPPPPPEWTCEANRCVGLQECMNTGQYRMGTQFGHHPPRRTLWGPFERK